jgi:hypothetical protein
MQTLKNNDFKEKVDEFVDSEGGIIGGDRNVSNDSEIETGPVAKPFNDDSDYEKGVSTTTDRASRYRQDIPWFAVYSYGGLNNRGLAISERKVLKKKEIEDEISEDLVKKSKKDGDMWDKDYDYKTEKVIDTIDGIESIEQLQKIKTAILNKIKNA